MSTKDNTLVIDDVSVSYGAAPVIHDISLQIKEGESFGLMGLNGAGKTTLIKAILGLREQDSGQISIYDAPCTSSESKARLAYLPERFEPPWFLTGFEFLRFSLKLYNQEFDQEHVAQAAEKLALDKDALKRRVQTYSKGMRQKLGLLGTILTNCSLLILDEPMSGLDPQARSLVKDMLAEAQTKERTIFLSSHILADMEEVCDRVAVLHGGVIMSTGTPAELKKKTGSKNLERAFLHFIEKKDAA
ncbi:MAG: ABC transporter [Micavibrio sp.]|nr:MAG: ABC transporter [Micavibrio sp.]